MVAGGATRRAPAVLFALAVAVAAPVARAQPSTAERAATLFAEGREALATGDIDVACDKLAESARLDPEVGTLGKLAQCEEARHRLVAARARWQQAENLARNRGDERLAVVQAEFERVDARVPKVRLELADPVPDGVAIRLGHLSVTTATAGTPVPLEPGPHEVSVSAPAHRSWRTTVELHEAGGITTVDVPSLQAVPASPDVPPPILPSVAEDGPTEWAYVSGAVGIAGLAVGVVLAVVTANEKDTFDAECDDATCTQAGLDASSRGRTTGALSTIGFVVGGVGIATGVSLYIATSRSTEGAAARVPTFHVRGSF